MPTSDPRLEFAPPKSEPRIRVYARIRAGSEARGFVVGACARATRSGRCAHACAHPLQEHGDDVFVIPQRVQHRAKPVALGVGTVHDREREDERTVRPRDEAGEGGWAHRSILVTSSRATMLRHHGCPCGWRRPPLAASAAAQLPRSHPTNSCRRTKRWPGGSASSHSERTRRMSPFSSTSTNWSSRVVRS